MDCILFKIENDTCLKRVNNIGCISVEGAVNSRTFGWSLSSSLRNSVLPPVTLATPRSSLRQAWGPRPRPKHLQQHQEYVDTQVLQCKYTGTLYIVHLYNMKTLYICIELSCIVLLHILFYHGLHRRMYGFTSSRTFQETFPITQDIHVMDCHCSNVGVKRICLVFPWQ